MPEVEIPPFIPATKEDIFRLEQKLDRYKEALDAVDDANRDRVAENASRLTDHAARLEGINDRFRDVSSALKAIVAPNGPIDALRQQVRDMSGPDGALTNLKARLAETNQTITRHEADHKLDSRLRWTLAFGVIGSIITSAVSVAIALVLH